MAEQHHNFLYGSNSFLKSLDKEHCLKPVVKVSVLNLYKDLNKGLESLQSHQLKIGHGTRGSSISHEDSKCSSWGAHYQKCEEGRSVHHF